MGFKTKATIILKRFKKERKDPVGLMSTLQLTQDILKYNEEYMPMKKILYKDFCKEIYATYIAPLQNKQKMDRLKYENRVVYTIINQVSIDRCGMMKQYVEDHVDILKGYKLEYKNSLSIVEKIVSGTTQKHAYNIYEIIANIHIEIT
jgi:hypothetical protein